MTLGMDMKVMMDKTNMDMDMGVVDRNHVVVKVLVTVETDHVIELNVA